ncbi:50S ribosomal protein L22 [Candidatus Micrarchaeota archaeon]|nr:50S ribosomal protein L22 [Candidatus Micrarchaeota archaeon]MBU1930734.1 50S ribosomal protein L22 [Candidatus Micrarchaeota archaeon]
MVKRYYNATVSTKATKKAAKSKAIGANVSLKYSTELCNYLKGKSLKWSESFLQDVLAKKRYVPLKRYNKKVAHRKGTTLRGAKAGRFPTKTIRAFQKLLGNAKANADYKGLDTEKLVVWHAFASQAFARRSTQSQGRLGGKVRKRKSAHLEVILMETR